MVFPPNYRKTALCYNASGDWECFFLTNATASGHHQLKNTICRPGRPKGAHMPNAAISEWMKEHRDEAVGFLQDIIRIPSVTGNEGPVQDFIEAYDKDLGLDVRKWVPDLDRLRQHPAYVKEASPYDGRPNVVAIAKGEGGGKSLLFNGHIDVIPEGPEDKWVEPCWSANIVDGKMYGRGTSDMKSGVAAFTMAYKAVRDCGIPLKGDIIMEYVMDEELTGNGTLDCCLEGYKADAGICCETSSMCVQPGSIGRIWFEIIVRGKEAGIQKRFEGVNAIDLGYIVKQAVDEYEKYRLSFVTSPLYPDILSSIPCMVGQFESGSYASAFPDTCVMKGSMATVPGEDNQQVKADFIRFITEYAAERSDWLRDNPPEVLWTGYYAEPASIPAESPIVQTLIENFKDKMNCDPVISGRQGAADIRHLITYGDTPTVIFGPGLTEQMHANSEYVLVEDYLNAIEILANTIVAWCG